MSKFIEFFQGTNGDMSSKRLGYLSTIPVSLFGTIWLCNKLIDSGKAELAVDVWNSLLLARYLHNRKPTQIISIIFCVASIK